ncbi:hypothetical protein [Siphonobacter sp. SORGH_AS_1065]|uniref:hypothetical protein n=1 Tax=Siphonobacter sp. SORGH_AS_1065 TaxID=3041795 RepID=UPI0027831B44|nr:hypothetical protein [Siphonobacter sp. SORGH_AS_1065]MDQ1088980.1 hypothetical protein [Siphonobacter sp. SORGH_AS_1065]
MSDVQMALAKMKQAERSFKQSKAIVQFGEAATLAAKSMRDLSNVLRRLGRYRADFSQGSYQRKLPRKLKKAYIKLNGRKAYHLKYRKTPLLNGYPLNYAIIDEGLLIDINSPGGSV